jgi:predicted peptidase
MKAIASIALAAITLCSFSPSSQDNSNNLQLKTASNHPMQYFVSLPKSWTKKKVWPVLMILEAADKEYKINAERFVNAREDLPFIIIAPYNTNNGSQGRRDPKLFPYSNETWDYMEKIGDCQFNDEGIHQIVLDVAKDFNGENQIYLTGFEAGAHALWSIVFNHPEYLRAAIPVAGNFRNRCVEPPKISKDPRNKDLPIRSIVGELDEYFRPSGKIYNQWTEVRDLAISKGFKNISEIIIPKKGHVPMPEEVLSYVNSIVSKK